MHGGSERASEQSEERSMARRASPEHPQQERREQWGVHERKHQLEHVHDIVEPRRRIRRQNAERDPDHRRGVADAQIVPVGLARPDVRLIVLNAVTLPAIPDMNDAMSAVSPSPSTPDGK